MPEQPDALSETAAQHLVIGVPTARPDDTVATAIAALRGRAFDCADSVWVTDPAGRLRGMLRLSALLAAPAGTRLAEIMTPDPPRCRSDTDQEQVATLAHRRRLAAVPVVDADDRLLGVVPPEALIDVLRREHVEDLHRLAGILHGAETARHALEESPLRRLRHRLPWLLVGLLGSVLATAVVARFEATLQARVAVAFFIPAIVYLADAIGTQTEAIVVRGLSLGQPSLRRLLLGELGTGVLIGLTLGLLAFAAVLAAFGDPRLAGAVGLALLIAGAVATTVGLLFPWALWRLGQDPAYGSGPAATIIQDVLSLLTYFLVASLLL